ncbi:MAG: sulfonate ABC transporter substrate-binding protein [Chloroflexales bacterium]|nr:sulfonate ABC transporter substrate-binding protein [Chloroflexales bacterium]
MRQSERERRGRHSRTAVGLAGVVVILTLLLAACGAASAPPAASQPTASGSAPTESSAPAASAPTESSAPAATTPPAASAPTTASASAVKELRIGRQKGGALSILEAQGTLSKRLEAQGVTVTWTEFPAGPQLLEALNVGSIDFGTTGEPPPIFAQAAGAPLIYAAAEPANPRTNAIIVPKDSPIKTLADLKGKKIAVQKASSAHYLLVQALKEAGLAYTDVEPVFLPPPDARAAFQGGSVDAWVIWDPFKIIAVRDLGATVLRDGEGLIAARNFYLTSRDFATKAPELLQIVLEEIQKADDWANSQPKDVAALLSPQLGIEVAIIEQAQENVDYGVKPLDETVLAEQQQVADLFFELGLLPTKVVVKDATLP